MMKSRQMELLIYLLKYRKTTQRDLADYFGVSTKTIGRDLDALSIMGIPIYCKQGVGGGVCLDENYKFNTSFFTKQDIHQIILALKIADSFSKTPKKDAIMQKLCLISPQLSTLFQQDFEDYLSIDLVTEKVDIDNELYRKINVCLDEEVLALINEEFKAAPIGYVLKNDGMYLFCYVDGYEMIKISEIAQLDITEIAFDRAFISYEEFKNITDKQDR